MKSSKVNSAISIDYNKSLFLLAIRKGKSINVPWFEKLNFSLRTLCGICFKVQILYPKNESILSFQSPLFPLICPGQYFQQHLPKHDLKYIFLNSKGKVDKKSLTWRKERNSGLFLSAQFLASRQQLPYWKLPHSPSYYFTAALQCREVQGCLPSSSRNSPSLDPSEIPGWLFIPPSFEMLTWSCAAFLDSSKIFFCSPSVSMLFLII